MAWTVYGIVPIDFGWEMLPTVKDVAAQLEESATASAAAGFEDSSPYSADKFLSDFQKAKEAAVDRGWEGDFRHDPVVFWLPDESEFVYAFVWKQDHNGTTFVVSPKPLDWLERLC